ncbi:MAG: isoprenylcysteine carboxylmethyltransferase family protein [Alphaproteobacteria bacterium]|nr:isoprenylcysteine carboxylmethyltransferase family protein [Alphaproteobacteria bacterium]
MKRALQIIFSIIALAAMNLALAGRWDWWPGWAFVILIVGATSVESLVLYRHNRELLDARSRFGKGTPASDYLFLAVFGLAFLGVLIVGPLDAGRFGWAPLPAWCFVAGAILYLAGEALVGWSMYENTFFEKTVRLQTDRNHSIVTSGPYAVVRHPGYTGFCVGYAIGIPLMLGSAWAFVPAAIAIIAVIVRTAFEDQFLADRLAGYAEYRQRTRYRLVPGLW